MTSHVPSLFIIYSLYEIKFRLSNVAKPNHWAFRINCDWGNSTYKRLKIFGLVVYNWC